MLDHDSITIIGVIGAVIVVGWSFKAWDEGRIDVAIKRKYPGPPTPPPPRLTWEQKRIQLERQLISDQKALDAESWPAVGAFLMACACFAWVHWWGLLLAIPLGPVAFAVLKLWVERHRSRTAKLLAIHLQSDRDLSFQQ